MRYYACKESNPGPSDYVSARDWSEKRVVYLVNRSSVMSLIPFAKYLSVDCNKGAPLVTHMVIHDVGRA